MVEVYLKNGKVLVFEEAETVKFCENSYYLISNKNTNFGKFEKDAIFGITWTYPNKIEDLISDNEEQIKLLNETINSLIVDYEKRLSQQQEIISDMEHKIEDFN